MEISDSEDYVYVPNGLDEYVVDGAGGWVPSETSPFALTAGTPFSNPDCSEAGKLLACR